MTDDTTTKARGGRPRKYASETKRPTLTFRVRGGLYEKLRASAEQRELSISEEIESRLEQSFARAADPYMDAALRMTAANCQVILELLGKKIGEDEFALMSCAEAAKNAFIMAGNLARPDKDTLALARELMRPETELLGGNVARLIMLAHSKDRGEEYDATKEAVESIVQQQKEAEVIVEAQAEKPRRNPSPKLKGQG